MISPESRHCSIGKHHLVCPLAAPRQRGHRTNSLSLSVTNLLGADHRHSWHKPGRNRIHTNSMTEWTSAIHVETEDKVGNYSLRAYLAPRSCPCFILETHFSHTLGALSSFRRKSIFFSYEIKYELGGHIQELCTVHSSSNKYNKYGNKNYVEVSFRLCTTCVPILKSVQMRLGITSSKTH